MSLSRGGTRFLWDGAHVDTLTTAPERVPACAGQPGEATMLHVRQLAQRRTAITGALATIAALLVMTHVGWQLFKYSTGHDYVRGLIKCLHLDEERNIPTLFSTCC